jgi:hypothetical protein
LKSTEGRSLRHKIIVGEEDMTDLRLYQNEANRYEQLSLRDLLDARDQYHVHLMRHPNVVATAIGRYRIRKEDSWPSDHGSGETRGKGERTLLNSEVRPYSWPAVLVFVEQWEDPEAFGGKGGEYRPDQMVPRTLYLPDGRQVPVCVIVAPKQDRTDVGAPAIQYPLNNIGGGYPVIADVQGQLHAATIACLVSDGHKVYALTNRHVTGDMGEIVYSLLGGKQIRVGVSSGRQLTRLAFTDLYPGWPGRDVFVNLDVGLVEIDDLDKWTAQIRAIGTMEPMADFAVDNLSLSLIGCHVRGYGAASGVMMGEIHGLFYRYQSQGGFEYVADLFFSARAAQRMGNARRRHHSQLTRAIPARSGCSNRSSRRTNMTTRRCLRNTCRSPCNGGRTRSDRAVPPARKATCLPR